MAQLEQKKSDDPKANQARSTIDVGISEEYEHGWVACSTDDVLAMKPRLYDVLVTLPPAYSKQAKEKVWPKVEGAQKAAIKATLCDLMRFV